MMERLEEATYFVRSVFGQDLRYPANGTAILFCELAGTQTITDGMMLVLAGFGQRPTQVHPPMDG